MGITVRNLTYELRRYFQKTEDQPGVIVSKLEPGGKASVAGIKPFEIVTHINGQPVKSVDDFKKLTSGPGELKMSINRMTKGRQVKITLPAATSNPASHPASQPASGPAHETIAKP
jgi:serine protease Do